MRGFVILLIWAMHRLWYKTSSRAQTAVRGTDNVGTDYAQAQTAVISFDTK
jgi:hypothetical protein